MKRLNNLGIAGVLGLLVMNTALAQPSRLFIQETARVAEPGSLSVDFDYDIGRSNADVSGLRLGIFDGEVMINTSDRLTVSGGTSSSHIGYKGLLRDKNIAVYGMFGYINAENSTGNTTKDTTNLTFGGAYTYHENQVGLNVNLEYFNHNDDIGAENDGLNLGVAGELAFQIEKIHASSLFAEVNFIDDDFDTDTIVTLGIRLVPFKKATLDFAVIHDRGNAGGESTGIPGVIKLNLEI